MRRVITKKIIRMITAEQSPDYSTKTAVRVCAGMLTIKART